MKVSMITRLVVLHPVSCLAWTSRWATLSARTLRRAFSLSPFQSTSDATTTTAQQETELAKPPHILLGGDFAGYTTQCDPITGDAQPVPVYLVPPSMLEWGQHPTALEVIVSENAFVDSNNKETWNRACLTVLPETGCGVDNLEVQKSTETDWRVVGHTKNCVGLVRSNAAMSIETIFGLSQQEDKEEESDHRLRVTVTLAATPSDGAATMKSIGLSYERRFDEVSTQGSRADGGGLDGASVSRWMGPLIAKQGVKMLETKHDDSNQGEEDTKTSSSSCVQLPANVKVQYQTNDEASSSLLCISHVSGQCVEYEWKTGDLDTVGIVA